MKILLLIPIICLVSSANASAQLADTLLTWRTYAGESQARVQLFRADNEVRPVTAVIDELAANRNALATDDARFVAETIGRTYGHDPAAMTFVFRIDGRSFHEEASSAKRLLLRATFTRTSAGRLGSPLWRVITREELARLTDRALY